MENLPTTEIWVLVSFILAIIILTGLVLFGIHLWKRHGQKIVPTPVIEEARPIEQAMVKLSDLLARLEPNIQEADSRILDAKVWTETLVKQILAVVDRIERMEEEATLLEEAIQALLTGDRVKVAYAAGRIEDASLKTLLRSRHVCQRDDLRVEAVTLLSGQRGTLHQWSKSYGIFVTALISQVAQAQDKVIMLEAGRTMLEASRPVLLIERELGQAQEALQLRAQPALRMMARQALPAVKLLN